MLLEILSEPCAIARLSCYKHPMCVWYKTQDEYLLKPLLPCIKQVGGSGLMLAFFSFKNSKLY